MYAHQTVFSCAVSLEFSEIFLYQGMQSAQIADFPCAGIADAIGKIFVTFDVNASLFQNVGQNDSTTIFSVGRLEEIFA